MVNASPYSLRTYWDEMTDGFRRLGREKAFDRVYNAYFERHRHYHNLDHIKEMFALFEEHRGKIRDPQAVIAAIFYHDIIYKTGKPGPGAAVSNEQASADYAGRELGRMGFDKAFIDRVRFLILRTQDHKIDAAKDPDAALFLDIDMAVLGRDDTGYRKYTEQIRKEYAGWPDLEFYKARLAKFLIPTLKSDSIFHTEDFRKKYERQAQDNLTAEKRQLETIIQFRNPPYRPPGYRYP